jgi:hypothetical protein
MPHYKHNRQQGGTAFMVAWVAPSNPRKLQLSGCIVTWGLRDPPANPDATLISSNLRPVCVSTTSYHAKQQEEAVPTLMQPGN